MFHDFTEHMIRWMFWVVYHLCLQPSPDLNPSVSHLELCLRWESDFHPVHDALSGQTGSAAAGGHQGGLRPGWLHDGAMGPDLCGGPAFPGPQADLKGQQEHRRAQSKTSSAPLRCWHSRVLWRHRSRSREPAPAETAGVTQERFSSKNIPFMNCNKFWSFEKLCRTARIEQYRGKTCFLR